MPNKHMWWDYLNAYRDNLAWVVRTLSGDLQADTFMTVADERRYLATSTILQMTWEQAPDHPMIHDIPGWEVLCDLLDGTVPYEEEDE